jgi:TrmH family RNA methyltransferase
MFKKITSLQHPLVKHLVKLRKNSDYRYEHKTVVIEGVKLVKEVLTHFLPKQVVVRDETLIPQGIKPERVLIVSENILNKITGIENSEGILAEVPMPHPQDLNKKKYLIALDGINDPGNMGTLLRTALALGWEGAFIVDGSCDPFNEKALRSSRGAIFRLPYAIGHWDSLESLIKYNKLTSFAADIEGKDLQKVKVPDAGILLILSNEAHGLSEKAKQWGERITIPMPGDMESLNVGVAGGIFMYRLKS